MDVPETASASSVDDRPIDPRFYLRVLMRRRWVVLAVMAVVFVLVAAYTMRQPKVYEASASVIIDSTPPKFLDNSQVQEVVESGSGSYWFSKEYYETQYKVIVSRSVAARVVDKLGLQTDANFLGLDRIKDLDQRAKAMDKSDATAMVQGKIKVKPVKDSQVVAISIEDGDPKRAALLANEVANAYIAESLALKLRVTESASRWLEDRLENLEGKTKSSELAVFDFKKSSDMLTTSLEDRQSMVSQRLSSLNGALTDVRTRIAGLKARVEAIQALRTREAQDSKVHWADALASQDNHFIETLKMHYVQAKSDCAELQDRYLASHPKLRACTEKLTSALNDLNRELDNIVVNARTELTEATAKERNLNALLEQTKAEAFEVNKKQIEFDRIKRDSDNNQRLYDVVLKRLKDIELSGLLRTSNVRVLDAALPQMAPIRPRVQLNLTLAMIFGALFAVLVAFSLEFLDTSIMTQEQVEEWLGLTFLGIIPRAGKSAHGTSAELLMHREPKSATAECCRSIRTNILFMSPDKPLKTILVTSSSPQDGKTTTAVSLAIAMAEGGSKVLLIDADMRRPRVHRTLSLSNGAGLSSLILGQGSLVDVARSTEVANLSVLTCGPIPPNPAELLHTAAFAAILKECAEKYDRVIIDSPPVGIVADGVVLSTQVDGTVVVLKAARTSRDLARRTVRALNDVNARVLGGVLNDLNLEDKRYSEYYYYRQYGYEGDGKESTAA